MNQPPGYPPGPPFGSPPGQGGPGDQNSPSAAPQFGQPAFGQAPQQPQQGFGQPAFGQAPQQPQQGFGQTPQFGQSPQQPQQGFGPGSFSHDQGSSLGAVGNDGKWRWHYSRAIGVMYGPIPVGLIVVAAIAILWYGGRYL